MSAALILGGFRVLSHLRSFWYGEDFQLVALHIGQVGSAPLTMIP